MGVQNSFFLSFMRTVSEAFCLPPAAFLLMCVLNCTISFHDLHLLYAFIFGYINVTLFKLKKKIN